MKCMPRNLISAVTADSEDANYPATNVLSSSQLEPWIAEDQVATLTLTVDGGANGVGLVAVEAISVDIVVKDGDGATIATSSIDMSGIDDYLQWMTDTGLRRTSCNLIYPYQMAEHTIEVTVDSGSATVFPEVGRAGAGPVFVWGGPMDLAVSQKEIGAVDEEFYDGGAFYVPGEVVKIFAGSVRQGLATEFWTWLARLGGELKRSPCFWWVTDQESVNWFVFARFNDLPSATFYSYYAKTNFELIEDKG